MASRAALALGVVACLSVSCGGNRRPRDASDERIHLPDGSLPDTSDAGLDSVDALDAVDGDAGMDASDANEVGDADGGDGLIPPSCTYDAIETFELGRSPVASPRRVAVAASVGGFGLAWTDDTAGPHIVARFVPSEGDPASTVQVTDGTSNALSPALIARGSEFFLAWQDNREDGYEIYSQVLSGDMSPGGSVIRLTNNEVLDEGPVMLLVGGGGLVGWTQWDSLVTTREAHVVRLGADASPAADEEVALSAEQSVSSLDLASLAETNAALWVKTDSDGADVMMQRIDDDGAPVDEALVLSTEHNADGSLDSVLAGLEGAVVFGVRVDGAFAQVRVRLLNSDGNFVTDEEGHVAGELALTGAPIEATGPSVSAFSTGYAVAYRVIAGAESGTPIAQLAFVDERGHVVETRDLGAAAATGGSTTTMVGPDGTILVAWADEVGTETIVQAARVRCE